MSLKGINIFISYYSNKSIVKNSLNIRFIISFSLYSLFSVKEGNIIYCCKGRIMKKKNRLIPIFIFYSNRNITKKMKDNMNKYL